MNSHTTTPARQGMRRPILTCFSIGCGALVFLVVVVFAVIMSNVDRELSEFADSETGKLIEALETNDWQKAEQALANGADIEFSIMGRSLLFHCVRNGNEATTRFLLENGGNVNSRSNWGRTPLHEAARIGNPRITELLLEYGADVNARTNQGDTALHYAEVGIAVGPELTESHEEVAAILRAHGGVR